MIAVTLYRTPGRQTGGEITRLAPVIDQAEARAAFEQLLDQPDVLCELDDMDGGWLVDVAQRWIDRLADEGELELSNDTHVLWAEWV